MKSSYKNLLLTMSLCFSYLGQSIETTLELRNQITLIASKNLRAFNDPETCAEWKEALLKKFSGSPVFAKKEEIDLLKTIATENIQILSEVWNELFSETSQSPAHYEIIFADSFTKAVQGKSYIKAYSEAYGPHILSLEKIAAQYPEGEPALAADRAQALERVYLAKRMLQYATQANKAMNMQKVAWFLALDRAQRKQPERSESLLKAAQVLASFETPVSELCPQAQTIRRAVPVDRHALPARTQQQ
ncbi:MAG: hypothetical protein R3A80_04430 [Bdellovibrionota bacterium]